MVKRWKTKRRLSSVGAAGCLASAYPSKMGGNLGDFQGVVTLGVAGDPKCIFPIEGQGISEGVPPPCTREVVYMAPKVHARECTWPEVAEK
jgi:hypothetical protein